MEWRQKLIFIPILLINYLNVVNCVKNSNISNNEKLLKYSSNYDNEAIIIDNNNKINVAIRSDFVQYLPAYGIYYDLWIQNNGNNLNFSDVKKDSDNLVNDINNHKCMSDIELLLNGINHRNAWALKVLDASGSPQSGFTYGNIYWYGSDEECNRANYKLKFLNDPKSELANYISPFLVKYVVISANYSTTNQLKMTAFNPIHLQFGICVPKSCSNSIILNSSRSYFNRSVLEYQHLYNLTINVNGIKESSFIEFLKTIDVILIIIYLLSIFIAVLFINILIELRDRNYFNLFLKKEKNFSTNISDNNPSNIELNKFDIIFDCFNLRKNFIYIMDTNDNSSVTCVNGLKSIACVMITILHFTFYTHFLTTNSVDIHNKIFEFQVQFVYLFIHAVEIFFVISGFLLTFNFLQNTKQFKLVQNNSIISNTKFFIKFILKRYCRLTPALLTTMAISHLCSNYVMKYRPYKIDNNFDLYCQPQSWWKNLLYIQVYFDVKEMCGNWTWYLAADMQYFIIFSIILMIYAKNKLLAKILFILLSIASVSYSFYVYYRENYIFQLNISKNNSIYASSFLRMNTYFGGVLAGYIYYKIKDSFIKLPHSIKYIWLLIIVIQIICLKLAIDVALTDIPRVIVWIADSFGHYFSGLLIGSTIIIITLKYGGVIGKLVLLKIFNHFHKLTYFMYLINPIVIVFMKTSTEKPFYFNYYDVTTESLGICVICYVVSIVLTLFYEIPFRRLSTYFLSDKKQNII